MRDVTAVVQAPDLAGRYVGVLQGVSVRHLDDLDDPDRRVIVDLDLLHDLTIRDAGPWTVRIASPIIPPFRAVVLGMGPVALAADVVEFESAPGAVAVRVKQVVFVRHEGEWILVLQLIRVDTDSSGHVYVYQYVSYPSRVARSMSETDAIQYVNAMLRLASALQRR